MPTKEIKELRKAGKLEEAYTMAQTELLAEPENIWAKRNMGWVLYSQLDALANNLSDFLAKLDELKQLQLPDTEVMFYGNLSIVLAKATRVITRESVINQNKILQLFDSIKVLPLDKSVKWYSILFGAMHKGLKDSTRYIEFADWWNFENFKPEDFEKERMPNGKEVMALAEQAYIAYAKHLLPAQKNQDRTYIDSKKTQDFLNKLSKLIDDYPDYQYPSYFKAKLLLALGENDNILMHLLPFAKKKQNDFWVWDILSEAFSNDPDKVFACYCRALSCKSPQDMLVNLRQRTARILIAKKLFNEAKTEIELCVEARVSNEWNIPNEILNWQAQDWYKIAIANKSNMPIYIQYVGIADSLLFSDIEVELVFVDFVNSDKKMLNFIASDTKFGFFKYERYLRNVNVGDILEVRFQNGSDEGRYRVYTAMKVKNDEFKEKFQKEIEGEVRITDGKLFGFIGEIYIHPQIIAKRKITNGMNFKGTAIKSYNREKKQWSWKLI